MSQTRPKRSDIVEEALSWKGTPYVLRGRVKGAGADCFTFPSEVMIKCGLADRDKLPAYQHDWFLHTDDEHYLRLLWKLGVQEIMSSVAWLTTKCEPGNIAVVRVHSRVFNHAAIVIDWPYCLHCILDGGVREFNITTDPMWAHHEVKIFDPIRQEVPC